MRISTTTRFTRVGLCYRNCNLHLTRGSHCLIICPIAIAQHGTDYKITPVCEFVCLSVCPFVCHLSYGRNSHSILTKLYTINRNTIGKNPFVGVKIRPFLPLFSQFFTPVMHCQWEVPNTTVTMPVDTLWCVIAQLRGRFSAATMRPLLKNVTCITLSHLAIKLNPKLSFSITLRQFKSSQNAVVTVAYYQQIETA